MDPEFFHYLSSFDILCLHETWLLKKKALNLPGFKIWDLPTQKSTKMGRGSRGLAILLSYTKGLEGKELIELQSTNWQVLYVYGCNPGPLICINVYLLPRSSSSDPLTWATLEDLLDTISLTYPSLPIFLCGDSNARMGSSNDTLKWALPLQSEEDSIPPINSQDEGLKGINKNGKCLFTLLYKLHLFCFNGSHLDNSKGFFSYITKNGASAVDYFMGSLDALPLVSHMDIEDRPESDHLPLKVVLHIKAKVPQLRNTFETPGCMQGEKRVKQSIEIDEKIRQTLNSQRLFELRNQAIHRTSNITKIYLEVISTIRPLLISTYSKKPPDHCRTWFDGDCKTKKKELAKAIRQVKNYTSEEATAQMLNLRKEYKALLRKKKRAYFYSQLEIVGAGCY